MAGKKVKGEVEGIRTELQNLSEAVWALREHVSVQAAVAAASSPARHSPNGATDVAADLARRTESDAEQGIVVTRGVFRNAKSMREYRWELEETAGTLLGIDDAQVTHVLAAIGHRQRLAILKTILNQSCSAADLVTALNLGTTGAAYHHLNVLQAADLVTQEERGIYIVQPHRVSAIFAILAGVLSASDTTYIESDVPANDGDKDSSGKSQLDDGGKRKKRKAA